MLGKVDDGCVGCVICRTNRTRVGFSCESVLEMHTFYRSMMSMSRKKTKIEK